MLSKEDIITYASNFKKFLTELTEIIRSIISLILNNALVFSIIIFFSITNFCLNYIAYEMPKRTIQKYFSYVDQRDFGKSWNMLTPQCQVRWKNGEEDFKEGYSTLATTKIIKIENSNPGNLFEALYSDKKQLIVDLIVLENFRGIDIIDSKGLVKNSQLDNTFWLNIKYKSEIVEKLKMDSLSKYRTTLKLVRRYRKVFTIQRNINSDLFDKISSNDWLISDVDNKEIGIINDTTFYN